MLDVCTFPLREFSFSIKIIITYSIWFSLELTGVFMIIKLVSQYGNLIQAIGIRYPSELSYSTFTWLTIRLIATDKKTIREIFALELRKTFQGKYVIK